MRLLVLLVRPKDLCPILLWPQAFQIQYIPAPLKRRRPQPLKYRWLRNNSQQSSNLSQLNQPRRHTSSPWMKPSLKINKSKQASRQSRKRQQPQQSLQPLSSQSPQPKKSPRTALRRPLARTPTGARLVTMKRSQARQPLPRSRKPSPRRRSLRRRTSLASSCRSRAPSRRTGRTRSARTTSCPPPATSVRAPRRSQAINRVRCRTQTCLSECMCVVQIN